jgi:hypothetical protein
MAQVQAPTPQPAPPSKPRKRHGCFFWGCLTSLGLVVIAALVIGIVFFNLPQRIGLVKPAAVRLLSQTPDRAAAQAVKSEMQQAGLNTTGVDVYVFPERNSSSSVMLTVLDTSQGFRFPSAQSSDAVADYVVQLAEVCARNKIERVAFEYRDGKGISLVTLTSPVDTALKYSQGKISRAEFLKAIDAQIDYSRLVDSVMP